jgi:hypothetical protein
MLATIKTTLTFASAALALLAALLWYKASTAEVAYDPQRGEAAVTWSNGQRRWDVFRTAELQARWNKRAAAAASLAAAVQALLMLMPE